MCGPVDVVTRLLHYRGANRYGKAREVAGSPKRLHLRNMVEPGVVLCRQEVETESRDGVFACSLFL